jgi:protein-L-isoaspartate(D-aspartate) O-methyltransferase
MTGPQSSVRPGRNRPLRGALEHQAERDALVSQLTRRGDIGDPRVLTALAEVPRELFVPSPWAHAAYFDSALPIDCEQTISQPYIVALMTQLVRPGPGRRILEIGTGSGYQAAILAAMGAEVFSVEILPELADQARRRLSGLALKVHTRVGDGHRGWPEEGPFDGILVTAAPREVPAGLIEQLAPGGYMVVPVGGLGEQDLWCFSRASNGVGVHGERVAAVRFVPMTGEPGASFVAGVGSGTMRHGLDRDRRSCPPPGARHRK